MKHRVMVMVLKEIYLPIKFQVYSPNSLRLTTPTRSGRTHTDDRTDGANYHIAPRSPWFGSRIIFKDVTKIYMEKRLIPWVGPIMTLGT